MLNADKINADSRHDFAESTDSHLRKRSENFTDYFERIGIDGMNDSSYLAASFGDFFSILAKRSRGESLNSAEARAAEAEQRAQSIVPDASGGYGVLPFHLFGQFVEVLEAKTFLGRSGAFFQSVPMSANARWPKVNAITNATWRLENKALDEQSVVFEGVDIAQHHLGKLVKSSNELLASGIGISNQIESVLSDCFARELDNAALYGDSGSNAKQPSSQTAYAPWGSVTRRSAPR